MVVTRRSAALLLAALAVGTMAAGCTDPSPGDPDAQVTIGLTYVPNVQFAPFYLAAQRGYFDDEGVAITLRHHGESEDLFGALGSGQEQVVVAGGDEMLQARSEGQDVVSVATLYQSYPVTLIVPESSTITTPADLAGRRIGIPGPFGETYFGLLAMLAAHGLTEQDVTIESIGYTQQSALSAGHVDAVMGFINNDVPQFQATGLAVRAVDIGEVPLVGISLGTTDRMTMHQGHALRGIITAVGRAVADISADPSLAVSAATNEMPGTVSEQQELVMNDVATATVPLYESTGTSTGTAWGEQDEARWRDMADSMLELDLIARAVDADEAFTNDFIAER